MQKQNEEEQILTNLGLTQSQAKVYLSLIHNGPAKVMQVSQATGIHRAHLYEILRSLEDNGFVDRNLDTGVFTATPLKEVAPVLVKRKQLEITNLENRVNVIADGQPQKTAAQETKPVVILTSNKTLTLNRAEKFLGTAQSTLDSMHTWKRFSQVWPHFEAPFIAAMERGAVIREIVGYPQDIMQAQEFLKRKSLKHKNFCIKFLPKPGGNFTLVDRKMLLLSTTQEKENFGETPFIFSNYEGLVGLMEGYFQLAWATGIDLATLIKNDSQKKTDDAKQPA